jgi:hypothetical protein
MTGCTAVARGDLGNLRTEVRGAQVEVREDELELLLAHQRNGLAQARRDRNRVVRRFQDLPQPVQPVGLVVDEQDALAVGPLRRWRDLHASAT